MKNIAICHGGSICIHFGQEGTTSYNILLAFPLKYYFFIIIVTYGTEFVVQCTLVYSMPSMSTSSIINRLPTKIPPTELGSSCLKGHLETLSRVREKSGTEDRRRSGTEDRRRSGTEDRRRSIMEDRRRSGTEPRPKSGTEAEAKVRMAVAVTKVDQQRSAAMLLDRHLR